MKAERMKKRNRDNIGRMEFWAWKRASFQKLFGALKTITINSGTYLPMVRIIWNCEKYTPKNREMHDTDSKIIPSFLSTSIASEVPQKWRLGRFLHSIKFRKRILKMEPSASIYPDRIVRNSGLLLGWLEYLYQIQLDLWIYFIYLATLLQF